MTSLSVSIAALPAPAPDWRARMADCAARGFDVVTIAPPFPPGRGGDKLLVADHTRLAQPGTIRELAAAAAASGLSLWLDLVIDRVAREHAWSGGLYRVADPQDRLPDPRLPPPDRRAALLRDDAAAEEVAAVWSPLIAGWIGDGIAGFRCHDAGRVPAAIWRRLIDDARARVPGIAFVSTEAGPAAAGFDLLSSSLAAWDLQSGWMLDETARLQPQAGLLATVPPTLAGPALHRATLLAAGFGQSWLIAPREADETQDVAAAIQLHRRLRDAPPARIVSAPYAPVAAIARGLELILANPSLTRARSLAAASLLPGLDGAWPDTIPLPLSLAPGEVRVIALQALPPILLPHGDESLAEAVHAPRIAIEAVQPAVEAGRFPARQPVGTEVAVSADIVVDGHDKIAAAILWRAADETGWHEAPMALDVNDIWTGRFPLRRIGRHEFTVESWADLFGTYHYELEKKRAAGQKLDVEVLEGVALVAQLAQEHRDPVLLGLADRLHAASPDERWNILRATETTATVAAHDPRIHRVRHPVLLPVDAESRLAGFASWYEIFPRSQSETEGRHGTFDDVIARLPMVREMGFDVLYFPPIHPIGKTNRKGPNNTLTPGPTDPGSPYAIGSEAGGHDAVHPELGTIEDFRRLVAAAGQHGLQIALDFAIQCSPDHPWLRQHPEWFTWRPDGSIRYAENPPKRYEDIVNVAFYAEGAMPSLWIALRDAVQFWVDQGVRIFRVDNPHTKPLPFWEWMIGDIRSRHPDTMFLAEAFTKPKMMYRLAKAGFTQSYTYFTWRNSPWEMRAYMEELTTTAPQHFFRPHFFVNTPDINPTFLHHSGRPGFLLRAALAATLAGLWGVYNGFELCEGASLNGREEYLDSEKYQLRRWDVDRPGNIVAEIRRLNAIRRTNPALHSHLGVRFIDCQNENLLIYTKATVDGANIVLVAVSFDPHNTQDSWFDLSPAQLGLTAPSQLVFDDLMRDVSFPTQTGPRHIRLDPHDMPFAIWRVRHAIED